MLDLFKKDEIIALKAKISELENENNKLIVQVEKKGDLTRKTLASRQEVDRELNEAKQQIRTLENELENLKKKAKGELNFRFSENLSKNRLNDILFLLDSMQSKTAALITIYLAKDDKPSNIPSDIASNINGSDLALIEKIESQTGKAIFFDTDGIIKLVMLPVFPILISKYSLERHFDLETLKNNLKWDKILVLNAHAGETFIGIVENDVFVEHDMVRSSVMGKHSKGGWSQKRFQSLVEEDIKHHADKVRDSLGILIKKHGDIEYVIAGGEVKLTKMMLEGYDHPTIMKSMEPVSTKNSEQVLRDAMSMRIYGL